MVARQQEPLNLLQKELDGGKIRTLDGALPEADIIVWGYRGHPNAMRFPSSFGWIDADSILGKGDWLYAKYRIKTEWSSGKRTKELKINCKKGIYVHDFDNSYVRFVRQRNGNWKLTFFGFGFDESKNPQLEGTYKFLCK